MSADISEAFFHRRGRGSRLHLYIQKIYDFMFYKQIILCGKTAALIPHRKFLIAEKKFLYRPMQAALACIFVLSGWIVFQNESIE